MTTPRLPHFLTDIVRARDVVALGQSLGNMTVGRVDASDMYRAGLVQAVSALDHYMHGIVLDLAVDIMLGRVSTQSPAGKIGLPFSAVRHILVAATPADRELSAKTQLSQRLSLETFQKPDDIGAALALVGVPKVWSNVFGNSASQTKVALGVIVTRRNRIVHQSDSDPLTPGAITPLSDLDALSAISTVEATMVAIDNAL